MNWPDVFDRTPDEYRRPYPHNFRVSQSEAFDKINEELDKMDAQNINIESGDNDDPGVVVHFDLDGQQFAVPCDNWDNLRDNAQAIAKYLEAKRALKRYGVETIEGEFTTGAVGGLGKK